MGKGSSPRPFSVSQKTFADNYDRIFSKRDEVACDKCGIVAASGVAVAPMREFVVCRACLDAGYNQQREKTLAEATDVTDTYWPEEEDDDGEG